MGRLETICIFQAFLWPSNFPFHVEGSLPEGEACAVSLFFRLYVLFCLKEKLWYFSCVHTCSLESPFLKVVIGSLAVGYDKQMSCGFLFVLPLDMDYHWSQFFFFHFLISHLSISIHGQRFPQTELVLSVNASCLFLMLPPSHIANRKC